MSAACARSHMKTRTVAGCSYDPSAAVTAAAHAPSLRRSSRLGTTSPSSLPGRKGRQRIACLRGVPLASARSANSICSPPLDGIARGAQMPAVRTSSIAWFCASMNAGACDSTPLCTLST
eukprot:5511069-Prymnesium_polylepis.2